MSDLACRKPGRLVSFRVLLSVASIVALSSIGFLRAADEPAKKPVVKAPAAPTEKEDAAADLFAIPDGKPAEILKWTDELQRKRMNFKSRKEAVDFAIRVQWALIDAGDKVLAQTTASDDEALAAAEMKLQALSLLTEAGIDGALEKAMKAAEVLQKDKRPDIAEQATETWGRLRLLSVTKMEAKERAAFIKETLDAIPLSKYSAEAVNKAGQLGEILQSLEEETLAADYYEQLAKSLAKSDKPRLKQMAEMLAAEVRRMKLPGNPMVVTGKTLEGKDFQWDRYKGKVVLVDFWATWCGPCVQEMPNVKENYEKYHEKGFEVVGISLDDDRAKLEGFIAKNEIPWTNLFAEPKSEGEPGDQPTAVHYAVSSIPTAILVGKDGKVITLNARGEILTELLGKLLGDKK